MLLSKQEAIDVVIEREGADRARYLLDKTIDAAYEAGVEPPDSRTSYVNTIPADQQPAYPGDLETERNILRALRWNATAMVVKANRKPAEPGGHIASFQSSAIMYEVGYHHFWKGPNITISGKARITPVVRIWYLSRAIRLRELMPVPIWKAGSAKNNWITSVWKPVVTDSRLIHILI